MVWIAWVGLVAALLALFVTRDLVFCGGRRGARIIDRMPIRFPFGRLTRGIE